MGIYEGRCEADIWIWMVGVRLVYGYVEVGVRQIY